MFLRPRYIERPLTSESPIQCALGSEMGVGGARGRHCLLPPPPCETLFRTQAPHTTRGGKYWPVQATYEPPRGGWVPPRPGGYSRVSPPGYPPEVPWGDPLGGLLLPKWGLAWGGPYSEYVVRLQGGPHGYTLLSPKPRIIFVEGVFSLGCYDNAS